jgi:hypothetical protein
MPSEFARPSQWHSPGGRIPFGGLATRAAIERHSNPNGLRRKTWKHSTITLRALLVLAEREF